MVYRRRCSLHFRLNRKERENPVFDALHARPCWLALEAVVVSNPDKAAVGLLLNMPGVAPVKVGTHGLTQLAVEFFALDDKSHFGIDAQGAGVEITTSDKNLIVVDNKGLGVKR